jgi:hypothetical protein
MLQKLAKEHLIDWVFQMWFPWRFSSPELVVGLAALCLFFDSDMVFLVFYILHKFDIRVNSIETPTFKKKISHFDVERCSFHRIF